MTQDEIIKLAREACSPYQVLNTDPEFLTRFAALVAAHEREACAKVCESKELRGIIAGMCAAAIRGLK